VVSFRVAPAWQNELLYSECNSNCPTILALGMLLLHDGAVLKNLKVAPLLNNNPLQHHWNSVATSWKFFGPPLRPSESDIKVMQSWADEACDSPGQGLMLGVTPELANLDFAPGFQLGALERSDEMIRHVWPGDKPGARRAQVGEWSDIPFEDSSVDCVLGDGCFISMPFPLGYDVLAKSIHRVLKSSGCMLMRFFLQTDHLEAPEAVVDDLRRGKIGSFHVFKWRLAMALQPSSEDGICLNDIWQFWADTQISTSQLSNELDWPIESIQTIELYRGKSSRFFFPRREEMLDRLKLFDIKEYVTLNYELGDRCPLLRCTPN